MKNDITFLIPAMAGGGAQKAALLLSNELNKRGWKVTILLCNTDGPYFKRLCKEIKIIKLKNRKISRNIFEIAKYLKQNKPGIFFSLMNHVNVIAGFAAKIGNYQGKLIFSVQMNFSERNANSKFFLNFISTSLSKIIYKSADAIACVSEGVKLDLIQSMPGAKNFVVIYNPVETSCIESKLVGDKFRIVSIGRLVEQKNYSMLIKAFHCVVKRHSKYAKDIELYILGDGNERESLRLLITELGLTDKVFLPGFVNKPLEILSSSDLFVLSSKREGLPTVLIEALSCGLPVISTDCPNGPSEILKNGQLGKLVPLNDVDGMADAIIEAMNNPDKYSTKEERILRAKDFSIEKVTDEYEVLFKQL